MFAALVKKYKHLLDLSLSHIDGSHTLAVREGESVDYQGRKKRKMTDALYFSDGQGLLFDIRMPKLFANCIMFRPKAAKIWRQNWKVTLLVIPTLFTQYFDIEIKISSHSEAAIYLFTKIKQVAMSKNYPHTATCYSIKNRSYSTSFNDSSTYSKSPIPTTLYTDCQYLVDKPSYIANLTV